MIDSVSSAGGYTGLSGSHPTPVSLSRNVQKNLQAVIKRLFEGAFQAGSYRQVVGIAIEARNLEILRETVLRASRDEESSSKKGAVGHEDQATELMEYILDICMNVVEERGFRNEVRSPQMLNYCRYI